MHDWDAIQRQYGELTYATAYRILRKYDLAVDCMQDVFVELYQNFKNTPVDNWPALLRWLAVRRALDSLRVQRRAEACSESLSHEIERNSRAPTPSQHAEFQELLERVRIEVAKLPAKTRRSILVALCRTGQHQRSSRGFEHLRRGLSSFDSSGTCHATREA